MQNGVIDGYQEDSLTPAKGAKTYVVVSKVVQRSLPVQVGDRVLKLNGESVSAWSFWELTHKLKHLALPLTLELMRTSQRVVQMDNMLNANVNINELAAQNTSNNELQVSVRQMPARPTRLLNALSLRRGHTDHGTSHVSLVCSK